MNGKGDNPRPMTITKEKYSDNWDRVFMDGGRQKNWELMLGSASTIERYESVCNNYVNASFCVNCNRELTNRQVMYSSGRCPICGFKGEDAGTIVDTIEKAKTFIRTAPWWKFWGVIGRWVFKD